MPCVQPAPRTVYSICLAYRQGNTQTKTAGVCLREQCQDKQIQGNNLNLPFLLQAALAQRSSPACLTANWRKSADRSTHEFLSQVSVISPGKCKRKKKRQRSKAFHQQFLCIGYFIHNYCFLNFGQIFTSIWLRSVPVTVLFCYHLAMRSTSCTLLCPTNTRLAISWPEWHFNVASQSQGLSLSSVEEWCLSNCCDHFPRETCEDKKKKKH